MGASCWIRRTHCVQVSQNHPIGKTWEIPNPVLARQMAQLVCVFSSTFVKDGATFWVGVETDPVQVVKRSLPDKNLNQKGISTTKIPIRATTVPNYTPPRAVQAAAGKHPIFTGCEDQKLCFSAETDCISSGTCSRLVTVAMSPSPPNLFTFELLATGNPGYIAVGLSGDMKMVKMNFTAECFLFIFF